MKIPPPPHPHFSSPIPGHAITIYTSGTTGTPKGVVLTHANLLANARAAAEILGIRSSDRALVAMPLCHSYALTLQVLTHLLLGAFVEILPLPALPGRINLAIDAHELTTFAGTTYLFSGMLHRGAGSHYPMRALRMVTSGAAFMPEHLRLGFLAALPNIKFFATYGLSEASPLVTVLPPELAAIKPISVGRIIPGCDGRVTSNEKKTSDAPSIGTPPSQGELLVRGPNVMHGYFENPKATRLAIDSDAWLHTGDLVRIDPDGDIIIMGRLKELIIRGGENIYPGEVEAVIARHPEVLEVAVVGIPDKRLGEIVMAAIVPKNDIFPRQEIIHLCRENLASFKVPKIVEFVTALEKTHTGKVRKNAIVEKYLKKIRGEI